MALDPFEIASLAKSLAREGGFELAGVSRPAAAPHGEAYRRWVETGQHGTMEYLARNLDERLDVTKKFPWAKSILSVGMAYWQEEATGEAGQDDEKAGRIARYAWGRDYHKVMEKKLIVLEKRLRTQLPADAAGFTARSYVDTGPVLERDLAAAAGLGWIGKHTLLIHPKHGSWFLLGELITSLEMMPDAAMGDHCGTCTRCIEACPTDAITPYAVDATKCISYQTLENRGEIPETLHGPMAEAGFLVGCDICQEVCPFNRKPLATSEADFAARAPAPRISLKVIADWTEQDWDVATRGRAHRRAKPAMWARNAAILAGNTPDAAQR